MKYIFLAGAPGSKWSGIARSLYQCKEIDTTDQNEARYYKQSLYFENESYGFHIGAYFDPGMEFGNEFDKLNSFSKEELETEFNRPFSGSGTKIIKSHVFCHHLEFIKETWPDCPLILVERRDDACLGWWIRCGGFDIQYPSYHLYYKNYDTMAKHIDHQNKDLREFIKNNKVQKMKNSVELAAKMGLSKQSKEYIMHFLNKNLDFNVYLSL